MLFCLFFIIIIMLIYPLKILCILSVHAVEAWTLNIHKVEPWISKACLQSINIGRDRFIFLQMVCYSQQCFIFTPKPKQMFVWFLSVIIFIVLYRTSSCRLASQSSFGKDGFVFSCAQVSGPSCDNSLCFSLQRSMWVP